MGHAIRLVLLPGLGADHRLFQPQRSAFPGLEVLEWITPHENETLPAYAARMAAQVKGDAPFFLGGVSFGGMVAWEMARLLSPLGLFLLGSCASRQAIPPYARLLGKLTHLVPARAHHVPRSFAPFLTRKFGRLTPDQTALFHAMLSSTPADRLKWGVRAMLHWSPSPQSHVPICQIHGNDDRLLPVTRVKPRHVIDGGGHLINLTHPSEVNAIMQEFMRRHS